MTATFADMNAAKQSAWGYVLVVSGCPYMFATGNVSSVAFTGTRANTVDWPSASFEPTLLQGGLVKAPEWTESIDIAKGSLSVGPCAFELRDLLTASPTGSAVNIMSYLADAQEVLTSSPLLFSGGTVSATATDFTTAADAGFTSDAIVYVDQEAIRCEDASATPHLQVLTRGIYGSKAVAHRVEADNSFASEVFSRFPGFDFRKVVLFVGTVAAGVLSDPRPIWRGQVSNSPRLKGSAGAVDKTSGAVWELSCDSIAATLDKVTLGLPGEACRTSGYVVQGDAAFYPIVAQVDVWSSTYIVAAETRVVGRPVQLTTDPRWFESLAALVDHVNYRMKVSADAALGAGVSRLQIEALGDAAIRGAGTVTIAGAATVRMTWNLSSIKSFITDQYGSGTASANAWTRSLDIATSLQPVIASTTSTGENGTWLYVASAANLAPMPYVATARSNGFAVDARPVLYSPGSDYMLELDPLHTYLAAGTVVDTANRRVRGVVKLYDKNGARLSSVPNVLETYGTTAGRSVLLNQHTFFQGAHITSDSWVYALQLGIIADPVYAGTAYELAVDTRDWCWSFALDTSNDTPSHLRHREWRLTGEQNLRDLVEEACQFAGACPVIYTDAVAERAAAITVRTIRHPLRSDVVDTAHTLTSGANGNVIGKTAWRRNVKGVTNIGRFTVGDDSLQKMTWNVQAQRSRAKYGPQQVSEVKVRGITVTPAMITAGPQSLSTYFLSRIEGLLSEPTSDIDVVVPLALWDSIYLGDVVSLTDWLAPGASGARGMSAAKALVIEKARDGARMILTCRRWPHLANTGGFAPCCRVASIAGAVLTVNTAYMNGSDYAGSNLTGYANTTRGTVANDGGAGYFAAAYKVELVERNNAAPRAPDSFTVLSVNTGTPSVTLTGAPNAAWQAIITGGGIVDVRFDDYATASYAAAQKNWPSVASRATRVIGGTADARYRWAA